MRISSDESDLGYWPGAVDSDVEVLLDGVLVDYIITADDETGEIRQILFGEDGGALIEDGPGCLYKTEVRRGDVKIVLPAGMIWPITPAR